MSNCVVSSGGSRLPRGIIAEHGVEGSDHFSHDGDDDDLGFLVGVGETIGEGPEGGIVSACAEGRHVEARGGIGLSDGCDKATLMVVCRRRGEAKCAAQHSCERYKAGERLGIARLQLCYVLGLPWGGRHAYSLTP